MRSQVHIPPVTAVYQCQLSMPSLQGWLMSSSLQATGEGLANPADLGGGIFVILHRGSNWSLSWAMDGSIMCHSITSSCQSAATSKTVKRCCSRVFSCKQRYVKYSDVYHYDKLLYY